MCYTYYMPKKKYLTLKSLVNHILTKQTTFYCIHENSRKLYLSYCHVANMIKNFILTLEYIFPIIITFFIIM